MSQLLQAEALSSHGSGHDKGHSMEIPPMAPLLAFAGHPSANAACRAPSPDERVQSEHEPSSASGSFPVDRRTHPGSPAKPACRLRMCCRNPLMHHRNPRNLSTGPSTSDWELTKQKKQGHKHEARKYRSLVSSGCVPPQERQLIRPNVSGECWKSRMLPMPVRKFIVEAA